MAVEMKEPIEAHDSTGPTTKPHYRLKYTEPETRKSMLKFSEAEKRLAEMAGGNTYFLECRVIRHWHYDGAQPRAIKFQATVFHGNTLAVQIENLRLDDLLKDMERRLAIYRGEVIPADVAETMADIDAFLPVESAICQ